MTRSILLTGEAAQAGLRAAAMADNYAGALMKLQEDFNKAAHALGQQHIADTEIQWDVIVNCTDGLEQGKDTMQDWLLIPYYKEHGHVYRAEVDRPETLASGVMAPQQMRPSDTVQ